jgi:WhiB family redox-sensing transcriptional regulator
MTASAYAASWRSAGACLGAEPDLFFPVSMTGPGREQVARARQVCARCEVRRECLEYALGTHQAHGIWGGATPDERRRELRRRTALTRRLVPAS